MHQPPVATNRAGSPSKHPALRHWLTALSTLSLVATLTIAGVAGATPPDKRDTPSKKAYIKAADDICREELRDIVALAERQTAEFGHTEEWTVEQLELFAHEFVSIGYTTVDALRALPAPRGGAKNLKPLISILEKSVDSIAADPTLLTDEDFEGLTKAEKKAERKARKKAGEYGFKVCGDPAKS